MSEHQRQLDAAMFESPRRSDSPKRARSNIGGAYSDEALIDRVFGSNVPAKAFAEVKVVVKNSLRPLENCQEQLLERRRLTRIWKSSPLLASWHICCPAISFECCWRLWVGRGLK